MAYNLFKKNVNTLNLFANSFISNERNQRELRSDCLSILQKSEESYVFTKVPSKEAPDLAGRDNLRRIYVWKSCPG